MNESSIKFIDSLQIGRYEEGTIQAYFEIMEIPFEENTFRTNLKKASFFESNLLSLLRFYQTNTNRIDRELTNQIHDLNQMRDKLAHFTLKEVAEC